MPGEQMTFFRLASMLEVGHKGTTKQLAEALDEALQSCAAAAARSGAKAKLGLVIRFEPGGTGELGIEADITTREPQPGAFPLRGYIDRAGRLVTEDPEQGRLPLAVVARGDGE